MRYPDWLGPSCATFVLTLTTQTWAFDGQVALGGGLGLANYDAADGVGPMASVYGAYGLSDQFDARLELGVSWLRPQVAGAERSLHNSALACLTYKLDVIEWVPWAGLGVGVQQFGESLGEDGNKAVELGVSTLFGLDWSWSRSDGLSLMVGLHALPLAGEDSPIAPRELTALLRYEHRWGW